MKHTQLVAFRVTPEELKALRIKAATDGYKSVSALLRRMFETYLYVEGVGMPDRADENGN